jgi:hypothetical protein
MKSITNNPFRVLSLPVEADARLIKKRIAEMQMYLAIGDVETIAEDVFLPRFPQIRLDESTITQANNALSKDIDRIFYSLFWFEMKVSADYDAYQALKDDNVSNAIKVLKSGISNHPIQADNFSTYKNLAILGISGVFVDTSFGRELFVQGVGEFVKTLHLFTRNQYYTYLPGTAYISNVDDIKQKFAQEFAATYRAAILNGALPPLNEILASFQEEVECDDLKNLIAREFSRIPIDVMSRKIGECEEKLDNKDVDAYQAGVSLYNGILKTYRGSTSVLGTDEMILVSDKLADVLRRSATKYFNANHKSGDISKVTENATEVAGYAAEIGKSHSLLEKIKEDLRYYREFQVTGKYFLSSERLLEELPKNIYVLSEEAINSYPDLLMRGLEKFDKLLSQAEAELGVINEVRLELCDNFVDHYLNSIIKYLNHTLKYESVIPVTNKLSNYPMSSPTVTHFNTTIDTINSNIKVTSEADAENNSGWISLLVVIIVAIILFAIFN